MLRQQVENSIRFITLIFIMACAAFGQSDYSISSFSKSVRSIPPATNQIIQPLADSGLMETKTFPDLGSGEVVMRMRFGADDYRMYRGKFSATAFDKSNSLSSFNLPAGMKASDAVSLKFYREKAVNPDLDESIVYFDNERIYVRFLPSIFFHRDTGWQSIDAVNLTRDERQARPLGDIFITSEPTGAKIFIDGKDMGVVTPNYATDLFVGEHTVRIEFKDYQPAEKKATVKSDSTATIAFRLLSALGSIQITSNPSGAAVSLNGMPSGATPLTLSNIKPGPYSIGLNKDLYESKEDSETVAMNQVTKVNVILKPNFGTLVLPQSPTSAAWNVDSKPTDTTTIRLNPGKHHVTWNGGEEFSSVDTIIDCPLGLTTTLPVYPKRLTGSIKVMPIPIDAEILINDSSYGRTGAKVIPDLPTGSYTVVGKKEGYQSTTVEVTVKSNTTQTAKISLASATGSYGRESPVNAEVLPEVAGKGENAGSAVVPPLSDTMETAPAKGHKGFAVTIRISSAVLGAGCAVAGYYFNRQYDNSYNAYMAATDQNTINQQWSAASQNKQNRNMLYIAAGVLGGLFGISFAF